MQKSRITDVGFDWDGTGANTEPVSMTTTRVVLVGYLQETANSLLHVVDSLEMRGKDFGQICLQLEDFINNGRQSTDRIVVPTEHLRMTKLRPAVHEALLSAELAPGFKHAVGQLLDQGYKPAIISNSPRYRIHPLLKKNEMDDHIPHMRRFSAYEDGMKRLKPDGYIWGYACEQMGIQPDQLASVEDSVNGMKSTKAADVGFRVGYVGLAHPDERPKLKEELHGVGAHLVLDHMRDLPAAIDKHNASRPVHVAVSGTRQSTALAAAAPELA